jgi:riboflavin kinase/FMN adenylyltransferase
MLTSLARRCELLAAAGAQAIVVESFTRELAGFSPSAFVDDVLLYALRARAIVVGYDFTYGHGRAGTTTALKAHGARTGVEVEVVAPVAADNAETASSSKIRANLRAGELAAANRLLGRAYDLDGTVVHGAKRGRAIGIPTANIVPETDLALATGIYACTLAIEGGPPLAAVASVGTNPTFVEHGGVVLEVHVLDWPAHQPEIYDRRVRTTFVARLRGESKFSSVDALVAQIRADIVDARAVLGC